jgi:protein-S-isoprenylcysteine O-methyltransferase
MSLTSVDVLGPLFGLSELLLALFKRSKEGAVSKDRGSLWLLWAVILASIGLASLSAALLPRANSGFLGEIRPLGVALFLGGLALRWWAIVYLGRHFTVNVSIAPDHRVVDSGPYRFVRHPSYAGALLAFVGLGICYGNYASLIAIAVPVTLAFLRRIAVEEAALTKALAGAYSEYASRTRRLVPWIY